MSKYHIQKYTASLVIVVATDDDQIVSGAIAFNGMLRGVMVTAPDLDDTDTYTIAIKDSDGHTVYTEGSLAESTTTTRFHDPAGLAETTAVYAPLGIPLNGTYTITITTSGGQAANRTFGVKLLIEHA